MTCPDLTRHADAAGAMNGSAMNGGARRAGPAARHLQAWAEQGGAA